MIKDTTWDEKELSWHGNDDDVEGPDPLRWFGLDEYEWCHPWHLLRLKEHQLHWFIKLLDECWRNGGILPSAPEDLEKIVRPSSKQRFLRELKTLIRPFEYTEDRLYLVYEQFRELWLEDESHMRRAQRVLSAAMVVIGKEAA